MDQPSHIAIIMDGNGRWAQQRNHARFFGHVRGTTTTEKIIKFCAKIGIKNLTLFVLSTENFNRPKAEINFLIHLLKRKIATKSKLLLENNISLKCIGNLNQLPQFVKTTLSTLVKQTVHCNGMTLNLAINYSGQQEIARAAQLISQRVQNQEISYKDIDPAFFASNLESQFTSEPDLIIRTGGEKRLSNFLLWQAAYSELYFTDTLWPSFSTSELCLAINSFKKTQRRFGLTSMQVIQKQLEAL